MDKDFLSSLLRSRMDSDKLSLRDAAKEAGVSHSTIKRILDGSDFGIDALLSICKFLNVPVSKVLNDDIGSLDSRVVMLLRRYPDLGAVFGEAVERISTGELDPSIMSDLASYMEFKIRRQESRSQKTDGIEE
jgi:transcriptional regulator with XRE-family HTH domain